MPNKSQASDVGHIYTFPALLTDPVMQPRRTKNRMRGVALFGHHRQRLSDEKKIESLERTLLVFETAVDNIRRELEDLRKSAILY